MADMINKDILPDALACMKDLSSVAVNKKQLGGGISCEYEESMLKKLSPLSGSLYKEAETLKASVEKVPEFTDIMSEAKYYHDVVLAQMEKTRKLGDETESLLGSKYLSYPTYGDLLFSVV